MMQRWQDFLNSFATPGGNLFLLVIGCTMLMGLVLHILHHGDNGDVKTVILSTFSGFMSALLLALRGRTSDVPAPVGTTQTLTTTSESTTAPASAKPAVPAVPKWK